MLFRSRHHQAAHCRAELGLPSRFKTVHRHGGAALLVVASLGIVSGIVKLRRQLHRRRVLDKALRAVELCQTFRNVLLIVIMPLRLLAYARCTALLLCHEQQVRRSGEQEVPWSALLPRGAFDRQQKRRRALHFIPCP